MRFHLLACPNAQTTREYSLCGFAALTVRFARMIKERGHTVYLYASEENEAPCDELITVITRAEQDAILGDVPYQACWFHKSTDPLWTSSYGRCVAGVKARKQPGDFLLTVGGFAHKPVFDAHPDLFGVEYSIGYDGTFAKYRVFESQFHRARIAGVYQNGIGQFFDETIPVPFDAEEFCYRPEPGKYLLYVGRITEKKGVALACQVAEKAGIPLKIIGHGTPEEIKTLISPYAEYLGPLPQAERNEALSKALAVLCPTLYLEPWNCVSCEAQLCGTPVISTPWGGFIENVQQGVSGFRCTMFQEFLDACEAVQHLSRFEIFKRAMKLYTLPVIYPQYLKYFKRVAQISKKGFYATADDLQGGRLDSV